MRSNAGGRASARSETSKKNRTKNSKQLYKLLFMYYSVYIGSKTRMAAYNAWRKALLLTVRKAGNAKGEKTMYRYRLATSPVVFGEGTVKQTGEEIKTLLGLKKVLVVTDEVMEKQDGFKALLKSLEDAGIAYEVYNKCQPDPPDYSVMEGVDQLRKMGGDGLVAFGGGSIIDTAKGISVMLNNPPPVSKYEWVAVKEKGVPLVAIPTTSGTGSESTTVAVISDTSNRKRKFVLLESASLAILDPELTYTAPPGLTAGNGMDVFSHASECFYTAINNAYSDVLAINALERVCKYLPAAVNDADKTARQEMMQASNFAGVAFTIGGVNAGHCIAHAMGATLGIPHGVACANAMAAYPSFIIKYSPGNIQKQAKGVGIEVTSGMTEPEIAGMIEKKVHELLKAIKLPSLKEMGFTREQVTADQIVELTMIDPSLKRIPEPLPTPEEIRAWAGQIYDTYQ
ncbi:MAG: iron-containing alcohol dehydrogenase [Oscillospiraceae bacterium]